MSGGCRHVVRLCCGAFRWFATYSYPIGAGTTYMRQEGYNASGLQKASIITYQPNGSVSPIGVRSGEQFYGSRKTDFRKPRLRWKRKATMLSAGSMPTFSRSVTVFQPASLSTTDVSSPPPIGKRQLALWRDGSAIIGDPISRYFGFWRRRKNCSIRL